MSDLTTEQHGSVPATGRRRIVGGGPVPDRIMLHSRSLAKDGARRQEIRAICEDEALIDYSGASWGELMTLEMVAEECAALTDDATHGVRSRDMSRSPSHRQENQ